MEEDARLEIEGVTLADLEGFLENHLNLVLEKQFLNQLDFL